MSDERRAWLALSQASVPSSLLEALLAEFGDAAGILQEKRATLIRFGLTERTADALLQPDEGLLASALRWSDEAGNRLIPVTSDDYPELLRRISGWPPLLYLKGSVDALHLPAIAIVGSRNPTRGGENNSRQFAKHLGECGFTIVSGLAQGIDSAAHRGALDAGAATIAVLGHGIDRVYPASNHELAHAITSNGALLSEYPLGTPPRREHFPARNRLISGLSLGTLVIEAAYRSGSLITARLASEQGREVFAIPGSIHNALARGCHRLIRDGAKLVESAADIIDELQPLVGHLMQHKDTVQHVENSAVVRNPEHESLLAAMGYDPVSADELAANSALTIDEVCSMLLILELEGQVEMLPGGNYSRLKHC
ncbi:DNA-processing protein DprA [Woeseia oceani]|uniref:DNA protecting protein DprA n=1 Tax=Woeseia oceani TaxID=1548547 RepID=A0A193LBL3_9GAMM|nr:DNA-processing protein DprA [Woeseia oceani]ANO49892.1 DNA protecting protein DprA [Woeseia oceani]